MFNKTQSLDNYKYKIKVKGYTRKYRSGSIKDIIPDNASVEVIEHRLIDNKHICNVYKSEMVVIGKDVHRSLQIEPDHFLVSEDYYYKYAFKT